jgi:Flp pilus assembly protein TadD
MRAAERAMTAFANAFTAHGAGRLTEAENGYRAVLAAEPRNADAWHLLGMLQHQRGQSSEAAGSIAQALRIAGPQAAYLTNFGVVLQTVGRNSEAVTALEQALVAWPRRRLAIARPSHFSRRAPRRITTSAMYSRTRSEQQTPQKLIGARLR